jgi:hypothetical protein
MKSLDHMTVAVLCALYADDNAVFAEQAIASIHAQDFPGGCIHVYLYVDGPIGPELEELLRRHEGWFYRIIRGEVNRGLPHGLNALLEAVQDETYLFRMDVDDIALRERFARQVAFLETHPEVDLCGTNTYEIDDRGLVIYARNYPETHREIVRRLPRGNPMLHPTYCIRAATWRRNPVRYRDLYLNEDLGFLFDLVRAGWRLHNLQERLFQWRTGAAFHRRRNHRRALVEFQVYLRGIRALWGISPKLLWPIARYLFRLLPRWLSSAIYRSSLRDHILR